MSVQTHTGSAKGKLKVKSTNRLKDRELKQLEKGRHHDGGGLYVNVTSNGTRSFVFKWTSNGETREMGLGSYAKSANDVGVTLAEARETAVFLRKAHKEGNDPRSLFSNKKAEKLIAPIQIRIFGEVAKEYIDEFKGGWRNKKHIDQWNNTLFKYCKEIWDTDITNITVVDIKSVLKKIWETKSETASRLRGRIEKIFGYAITNKLFDGPNPAIWQGNLVNVLPPRSKLNKGHMKAMPYQDVPSFYQSLCSLDSRYAFALRFVILNASRSGEVRLATWNEIDFDNQIWVIPGQRMKCPRIEGGILQPHRVPLTEESLAILKHQKSKSDSSLLIFPGAKEGKPLSDMTLTKAMRDSKLNFHVHGFRTSFRNWALGKAAAPFEYAELSLAHRVGNSVVQSYLRDDFVEERRSLLKKWHDYLLEKPTNHCES